MNQSELAYKDYAGSVEVSIEDGCLHGRILFIDDMVTYEGQTVPEIQTAFEAAVERYLAHCERVGKAADKPYSGTFNVRIGAELHGKAAKLASRKGVKLNEFVRQAVQAAVENDGVVRHHHKHDINVNVHSSDDVPMKGIATASSDQPALWERINVH
ncbi:MAG TPA: type II toxin-antitoxin system HicB family antitoxin [Rhodocyclaceae bacterium]|nr:type II toxin-antitoxin system HicB family antitoxin [Rhodocyclaceae bacterium]